MDFFPVFLNIKGRNCLVVGGGGIAARKVSLLVRAGARVEVVSPELGDALQSKLDLDQIEHQARDFQDADLENKVMVIAATDDHQVNKRVSELAQAKNLPVNVVDQPELCSFIMPSVIDRSPVQVAISTGGASPVLARLLRAHLETFVPAAYGRLASLFDSFRDKVKTRFPDVDQRRKFWDSIMQGDVSELLFAGRDDQARELLDKSLEDSSVNQ